MEKKSVFHDIYSKHKNAVQFESRNIPGVSAKIFELNISVICQRIFMKFKMQICQMVKIPMSNNKIISS
jgi:hypothetical protein